MQQPDLSGDPVGAAEPKRRRLFSSASRPPAAPIPPVPSVGDTRLEAMIAAYHQVVVDRLEDGLRTIQQTAVSLMHEIASEVWRTADAQGQDVQARILSVLSRDQAIRGLIAHSDERFQTIDSRVRRVEGSLSSVEEATREMRDLVERSVQTVRDVLSSPAAEGIEEVRKRLSAVERYLGTVFQHLNDRDQALASALKRQTREHEAAVRQESARVLETLETSVESGAIAAVDRLVETVTQQVQWVNARVERHARALAGTMAAHENRVQELLERPTARIDDALDGQVQAVRAATEQVAEELSRSFNERLVKLANLVRSDTEWTHQQLIQATASQSDELARALDDRLGRMTDVVVAATTWAVREIADRAATESERAVQVGLADVVVAVDRRLARFTEDLDAGLNRVGERAARAVEEALTTRLDGAIHRVASEEAGVSEGVAQRLDDRVGALARLIRADNQVLAKRLDGIEEQAAAKEAIRAVKELAASLPNDIAQAVDRRFAQLSDQLHRETQSTVESVVQAGEAVAHRVDRAVNRVNERIERDLDGVIDGLGDAMDALASGWTR
jgi:hypothetical protein